LTDQKLAAPECFISYAWGNPEHEHWSRTIGDGFAEGGIGVMLDRWHNPPGAASSDCGPFGEGDRIVVVGTNSTGTNTTTKT